MTYRHMPLFPPSCDTNSSMCMPLFDRHDRCMPREECQCVHIRNPACPEEYADVELCVDCDGNLSICVKRPTRTCMHKPCKRKNPCSCPPWYR